MDNALRNRLYSAVVACRRVLEDDLAAQLEGGYGVRRDGAAVAAVELAHLDDVARADRAAIEAALAHYGRGSRAERVGRFVRQSAFTWLNRLAALKLMEHPSRALIQPSIAGGDSARGFAAFRRVSPAAARGQADGGYRLYLSLLADDLAQALGGLFDRRPPTALLFPGPAALQQVLGWLNDPALAAVWAEDETIGWVYQYFTPTELRQAARQASAAPRDSYELSFRNQFYTPRYVVDFLAHNTLGRLWRERRGGQTRLAAQWPTLLAANQSPAAAQSPDPRHLRILDPACGSGHFLLTCFDMLAAIYDEAYDDCAALRADYADRAALRLATPGLILAHNLHGIDVDRRAVQIARLALWLRGQRALAALEPEVGRRPALPRPAIVCAEPMPGEADLLAEFAGALRPPLAVLLPAVWAALRDADEIGSLLRVERAAAEVVAGTKGARAQGPGARGEEAGGDEAIWDKALEEIRAALREYVGSGAVGSESAVGGQSDEGEALIDGDAAATADARRRLFAAEAGQGLDFLDLVHQPFDVVLMNPPFGAPTPGSKPYLERHYPRSKHDLYAAFVERGLELLRPGGYLGAITSRTGFFLTTFQKWREEVLLGEAQLVALADLGYGVLDTAMVETAAYVVRRGGAA